MAKMTCLEGDKQIYYKEGYKYQLTRDTWIKLPFAPEKIIRTWFIEFRADGWLWIRKGYAWDGPSGPTVDTHTFMRSSLIHDVLYQLMRMTLLPQSFKKPADVILYRISREDGMMWFRAQYVKKSMVFSGFATSPENKKEELMAPKTPCGG